MPGLLRIEDSFHRADDLGRRHTLGLVDNYPAVHGLALF